jgi:aminoglycoside 2''-phosphotransferase
MQSITQIITQIEANFPQFKVWQLSKLGEGWDYQAYRVNNDYVFRFPKSKEIAENLAKEICLLPKIQSKVKLKIPNFEFVGFNSETDSIFVGYREIKGTCLTKQVFEILSTDTQERVIAQIAEFLNNLHTIALKDLQNCQLKTIDFKRDYEQDFQILSGSILSQLSSREQRLIIQAFRNYLDDRTNFDYIPCLLHNDLSSDHILFDLGRDRLNGIIDFGDIAIGDPDYDLMYLLDDLGNQFIERLFNYYYHSDRDRLRQKLNFFQLADAVQLTIAGINDRDIQKKTEGLEAIESLLAD